MDPVWPFLDSNVHTNGLVLLTLSLKMLYVLD